MTRILPRLALMTALVAPAILPAQSTDKLVSIGVSGGLSLPLGDFADRVNSGYNVTGHVHVNPAALKAFRLRADVSFDQWDSNFTNLLTRSLGLMGNVVFEVPSAASARVKPYVLGGLGVHNGRFVVNDRAVDDSNFGLQAGGGLTIQLSGFASFAEAKFVNVFGDGSSQRFVPITFGVRF